MRTPDHEGREAPGSRGLGPKPLAPASLDAFAAGAGNQAFAGMVARSAAPPPNPTLARTITITASPAARPRVPDFINSLNQQSPATLYMLAGDRLSAMPQRGQRATNFDNRMRRFTTARTPTPLHFVRSTEGPTDVDAWRTGTVDVDDMLASSNESFRQNLIHFITERRATRNYRRRVGGSTLSDTSREFTRAHGAGLTAERDHIRRELHDWSITGPVASPPGAAVLTFTYRSRLGYQVVHQLPDRRDDHARRRHRHQGGRHAGRFRRVQGAARSRAGRAAGAAWPSRRPRSPSPLTHPVHLERRRRHHLLGHRQLERASSSRS